MPTEQVVEMIFEALRAMAIGLPGVFVVLLVFYGALKLMMAGTNRGGSADKQ